MGSAMGRMMGRSTVQFEVLELPAGPDVQQNNWDFSDTLIHLLHVLLKNLPAVASMPADKY